MSLDKNTGRLVAIAMRPLGHDVCERSSIIFSLELHTDRSTGSRPAYESVLPTTAREKTRAVPTETEMEMTQILPCFLRRDAAEAEAQCKDEIEVRPKGSQTPLLPPRPKHDSGRT